MRPITRFVIGFAASYALAGAAIVADGLNDHLGPSDLAVVLGSKVDPDGRPSPSLAARLDEAVLIYRRGLARNIVVSGGIDANGHSEADVMQAYMIARGVPASAIAIDRDGANTRRTADNTARMMKARGFTSVIAVSQIFPYLALPPGAAAGRDRGGLHRPRPALRLARPLFRAAGGRRLRRLSRRRARLGDAAFGPGQAPPSLTRRPA